jgi:hypothetical protein
LNASRRQGPEETATVDSFHGPDPHRYRHRAGLSKESVMATRPVLLAGAVVLIAAVVVAGVVGHRFVAHEWRVSTRQLPPHFVELFFVQPGSLSPAPPAGRVLQVEYAIRPHFGSTSTRDQGVEQVYVNGKAVGNHSFGYVLGSQSQTFTASFVVPPRGDTFRLTVTLPGQQASISYMGQSS